MKNIYCNSTFGTLALSSYLSQHHPDKFRFLNLSLEAAAISHGLKDPDALFCLSIGSLGDIRLVENFFFMVRRTNITPSGTPKFILGGAAFGFINCHQFIDAYPEISHIVIGEGYQALEHLLQHGSPQRIIHGHHFDKIEHVPLSPKLDWHAQRPIPVSLGATGCSWAKCRFCHHLDAKDTQRRPVAAFCRQLEIYYHAFGWKHFYIYDNYLEPEELETILLFFRQHQMQPILDIFGMRINKAFISLTKLLQETKMVRLIGWGLEAYSQPLLNLYRKGIQLKTVLPILQAAAAGGASSLVYILLGLPGSRPEDYRSTYRFLQRHLTRTGLIHQVLLSWFLMNSYLIPKMSCQRIKLRLKANYRLNHYFGNRDEFPKVETVFNSFEHWSLRNEKWISRDTLFLEHRDILSAFLSLPSTIYDYRAFFLANDTWREVWGADLNTWLQHHPPAIARMERSHRLLGGIQRLSSDHWRRDQSALAAVPE